MQSNALGMSGCAERLSGRLRFPPFEYALVLHTSDSYRICSERQLGTVGK